MRILNFNLSEFRPNIITSIHMIIISQYKPHNKLYTLPLKRMNIDNNLSQ